ncbi:MAG: metallophosphoesterase [Candidatus Nitrosopolaris sp.]
MTKIIVTSDQHLGYDKSNVADFNNFLDYILTDGEVESLILLGDLIDMWRRDASGLFLEFSEIVRKLFRIAEKVEVHIVAGNHDYHLLRLLDHGYPFKFYKSLPDPSSSSVEITTTGNKRFIFKHGWEFDLAQHPLIMEAMCHNMSDEEGQAISSVYHILDVAKDSLDKDLKEVIHFHDTQGQGYVKNLLLPPEKRLESYFQDVERKAYESVGQGETLVFGHTHRPFVSNDQKVINSGCWVSDAQISNTFVQIEGEEMRLCQFTEKQTTIDITAEHTLQIN